MDPIARFGEYAAAFEVFVEKNDPSVLEPFFTEDAVYETLGGPPFAGRHEGRKAVIEHLRRSLDTFDRRFESRELELLDGPSLRDGAVWISWRATYRAGDAPPLSMEGEETARFEGDRISRLEDRFSEDASHATLGWLEKHGAKLAPGPA